MYYLHSGYRSLGIDWNHQNSPKSCGFGIMTSSYFPNFNKTVVFLYFLKNHEHYLIIIRECTRLSMGASIVLIENKYYTMG